MRPEIAADMVKALIFLHEVGHVPASRNLITSHYEKPMCDSNADST